MTVKLLMDWPDSRDGKLYVSGNLLTTDAGTEAGLIAANMATSNLTGGTAYVAPQSKVTSFGQTPLYGDYVVKASDDGQVFNCTTALTITIPAALLTRPSFVVIPPSSGNASIAVTGGAQINGATSTLTRSRANNAAGIAVVAYTDSDGYGVSGS